MPHFPHPDGTRTTAPARWSRRHLLRLAALALPVTALARGSSGAAQAAPPHSGASRFVTVNGARLHYLEWGTATARPPLVLLHPAPLNAAVWTAFGAAMAGEYRVLAPDARGFGDSAAVGPYSDDVFLEDVHGFLQALGVSRAILCGNSMGGTLAYSYASVHPEVVDRLIVVDTGPGEKPGASPGGPLPGAVNGPPAGPPNGPPRGGPPMPAPGPFASREEAASRVPAVMGPAFLKAMLDLNLKQGADGTWRWKFDPEVLAAGQRSMGDPRKWPRWQAVTCPTLVLRGEHSPALSPRIADQMVAANPKATLVVVPGAGHFIPLEQPAAFEAAVRAWLSASR